MPAMRVRGMVTVLGALALLGAAISPLLAHAAVSDADDRRISAADDELIVGAQLEALGQVRIGGAVLGKGSKIGVFGLSRRNGVVDRVDVQLADGHVVRDVAVGTIRARFRQVADRASE
jgi:hypothetical protein